MVSAEARCLAHNAEEPLLSHDQGQLTAAQNCMPGILKPAGKRVVAKIIREGTLYPPGIERLNDVFTNYTSLTGSDKMAFRESHVAGFPACPI